MSGCLAYRPALLVAASVLASVGGAAEAQGTCTDIVASGVHCAIDMGLAGYTAPAVRAVPTLTGALEPLAVPAALRIVSTYEEQQAAPPPGERPPVPDREAGQRDVVVTGRSNWEAPDPLASVNLKSFEVTEAVDKAVIGPLALAYRDAVPKPIRDGAHNFLYNMREPVVFLNFILQLKIGRALETVGRFAVNTTVGVAGIFDMAKRKPFKWQRRSNGFANTFGFYGIKPGPFLFLPIVGPTTPRDLIGGALDRLIFPFVYGKRITRPAFAVPFAVVGALDHRADFDDTLHQLHDGQSDPYARSRDFYLQRRQNEIDELKGRGQKNSSPMSEAPTRPVTVKKRSGEQPVEEHPQPPPGEAPR
ncbi:VacJ family lipoprotein [Sphingomonas sp. TX0543]|uniref:MlaA family lipoprotein n=1 Tax=unclassified Sphingomonas TaxID=196159 RepID=UPI0010F4962A|nr:VacJ family lipoprotein [Sphingomonas sp. 3P27F8]